MSLKIICTCDKCNTETVINVSQGGDVNGVLVGAVARYLTNYEAPGGKHLCYPCMVEALEK